MSAVRSLRSPVHGKMFREDAGMLPLMYCRFASVFLVLSSIALAQPPSNCLTSMIEGMWLHSYEEDHDGILVFRPPSFDFPMARGPREGFRFDRDGKFIRYGIGPTDRGSSQAGTWRMSSPGVIELRYPTSPSKPVFLKILACSTRVLEMAETTNTSR